MNKNTTHRMYQLLRDRVICLAELQTGQLDGDVEIDESYFGSRRVRGKRGRGASGKTPVIGLLKRGGKVFVEVVSDCSKASLMPVIKGRVLPESTLFTDGWKAYDSLVVNGYAHHRIHHHENEFARGKNHVNGIESFWAYAKLRMAKMKGIRRNHFIGHLKETQWRFNQRHEPTYLLLKKHLSKWPLS